MWFKHIKQLLQSHTTIVHYRTLKSSFDLAHNFMTKITYIMWGGSLRPWVCFKWGSHQDSKDTVGKYFTPGKHQNGIYMTWAVQLSDCWQSIHLICYISQPCVVSWKPTINCICMSNAWKCFILWTFVSNLQSAVRTFNCYQRVCVKLPLWPCLVPNKMKGYWNEQAC